nr:Chain P, 10-meric peptide from Melanoma antigen recognized by T-cells 1 [Homo sapiens]
ELAGWGILTV